MVFWICDSTFCAADSFIKQPYSVSSSCGLPCLILDKASDNFLIKMSWMDSWTRNRFEEQQVCPAFSSRPSTAAAIAFEMSASSSMIKGSFPPNSKKTRLSVFAPISASETPTSVLPVREIAFTLGLFARIFPINSPEPVMICSTLPGISCSIQRAIIFINVRGGRLRALQLRRFL